MNDLEREAWRTAQLAGESALTKPPPDAEQRILDSLMSRIEAGAAAQPNSSTAASAATSSGGALWVKGALVLGLMAGGGLLWSMSVAPPSSNAPGDSDSTSTSAAPQSASERSVPVPPSTAAIPVTDSTPAPASIPAVAVPLTEANAAPRRVSPRTQKPRMPKPRTTKPKRRTPRRAVVEPSTPRPIEMPTAPATDAPAPIGQPAQLTPPPPEPSPFKAASKQSLRAEWRVLADARAALRNMRLNDALRTLDTYRRRFPAGRLNEESWLLRIRVLLASKRLPAAREAAKAYRRRHPRGAMRTLIEQLFESKEK